MKILQVIEATLGGTARHIVDLSEGMVREGHEVHLVYSRIRADESFEHGLRHLHESGLEFHSYNISAKRAVGISDFRALWTLQRYIRQHGPFDVIHSHSTKAGFLERLLPRSARTANIYSPHALMTQDPHLRGPKRWAVSSLEATLAHRCDRVIVISAMERACALRTGIAEAKLSTVHNGSKPHSAVEARSRAEIRTMLGLPPDGFCIATIGLLVENKEHARLLDAFADFRRNYGRRADLVVIGWGPMKQALHEKAAALGIGEFVHLLGQVPALEYFPAFDILAHPSRYEGFATVYLEALNAGVPIVTTNVGGAAETVIPDVTGFICDPWDTETFARQMLTLANDPEKREAMGRAGHAHVQNFTAERMVQATLAVYAECLAEKAPARALKRVALSREAE